MFYHVRGAVETEREKNEKLKACWRNWIARRTANPKLGGSNPSHASQKINWEPCVWLENPMSIVVWIGVVLNRFA